MSTSSVAQSHQPSPNELRDRVILVTGAGSGIGRTVALTLAAHGATVVLSGRSVRKLESVYDDIIKAGGPLPGIAPLNLEKAIAGDYDQLADAIGKTYGRLDGLLHNAAILGQLSPIDHYDVPTWVRVLHVNLTAAFALTQVCLPWLRKSADASVVFTTSGVGRTGRGLWGAYSASKFGVEGLSQVLADETRASGTLRVNCINPGATRTNMRLQAFPAEDRSLLADPQQLMPAYLYLLGPASRGVTGQSIDCQSR